MGPSGPGRDSTTLEKFSLGAQRCAEITLVSADAAEWIATVVAARCKNAELCLDPFQIVAWARHRSEGSAGGRHQRQRPRWLDHRPDVLVSPPQQAVHP
jgi:hypothetical protein